MEALAPICANHFLQQKRELVGSKNIELTSIIDVVNAIGCTSTTSGQQGTVSVVKPEIIECDIDRITEGDKIEPSLNTCA